MTERDLQLAIMRTIRSSIACACPNYTPIGWWECDVWAVTKSGYAVEYECKVTASDFRADAEKKSLKRPALFVNGKWVKEYETKHQQLAVGDPSGPSRFYYVVPKELEMLEIECPAWAGFATVGPDWQYGIRIQKQAPLLHKGKIHKREIKTALSRMWHRYWALIQTCHERIGGSSEDAA